MRTESELEGLALLGAKATAYPSDYDPGLLEKFAKSRLFAAVDRRK